MIVFCVWVEMEENIPRYFRAYTTHDDRFIIPTIAKPRAISWIRGEQRAHPRSQAAGILYTVDGNRKAWPPSPKTL